MKRIYIAGLIIVLASLLATTFGDVFIDQVAKPGEISQYYIDQGVADTGAINLVTAILFDYRGFDTLGEATVILVVVSTISLLANPGRPIAAYNSFSALVHQGISLIVPFLYVLGFYLILYGHLSPGGGFAGGVVIATIFILLTVTYGLRHDPEEKTLKKKSLLEKYSALGFVLVGLIGVVTGSGFLANGQLNLNLGTPGNLISAGVIPILNLLIGLKVGSGLSVIFIRLVKE
ncbi:hydrogen gas-evolving membrane-bound hydrogenase subunit E [Halanaerobaculum tunisiense]